ncbi:YpdA family putative bacillithiol disulfide reductase [Mammaliicoccus sciuri]|uniref:Thioredoxin reductase (NADPH) n=1 Tax=Sporosarcina newyorkensis TaxID=759851 RepID=A0A1T4XCU7_9BACL|nr:MULTISPECIES: YpdA family putative bacillithiol disulfide reductase [Sporosarcina]MBY0222684.1 YpdA family putative bacillithiol disulfide reductase [Sporosarcina aquimarina]SKA87383.1 thioredoxin reductase (NADPH) [Sporosarcina newyorkensis]
MYSVDAVIVGGGPCGLSAAIELQKIGLSVIVIEKGNIVHSIYNYPTHQTFFSSSSKLSIGDIPFITAIDKPKRNDALVYYRTVAQLKNLRINSHERVENVQKQGNGFIVQTDKATYEASYVVVATGYYDQPNSLNVKGEELPNVYHYFKEAHPYFNKNVVVIGGKNSAVDAALELQRAGAHVSVIYRKDSYSASVKPWILPGFDSLVRNGQIQMYFNACVTEITETAVTVTQQGKTFDLASDYVFAMIGYHPDHPFLRRIGIQVDEASGRPIFNEETMETNVENLFIAGVIAAGNNANEIFIENGRFHGGMIAAAIKQQNE